MSSFDERCDEGRLGSRLCCICVWEAAESHELDSGTSWALKTLFIKSESGGQTCKLTGFFSRMWATGGRGRGLLLPSSQGPGPALAAENCWSYELLLLTTRTFLPKHRTNPTASVWWCGANHLKEDVHFFFFRDTLQLEIHSAPVTDAKHRGCVYLSWWKIPWSICPPEWAFGELSPAARWSGLCDLWHTESGEVNPHFANESDISRHLWFWNPIKCVTYLHLWSNHPPSEVQTDNLQ